LTRPSIEIVERGVWRHSWGIYVRAGTGIYSTTGDGSDTETDIVVEVKSMGYRRKRKENTKQHCESSD
jgi:hypothetical protein